MEPKHLFKISVVIHVPPSHVWKVMSEVEKWPVWTPSVRKIRRLDKGEFAVGSRAVVYQPKLPPALWRVTELNAERDFTWVSSVPGVHIIAHHSIEPVPEGSIVMLSVQYKGLLAPVLSRLTAGITSQYLEFEAGGLKNECERTYPAWRPA